MTPEFFIWWLFCFLLTEIAEVPVAWALLKQAGVASGPALTSALLASVWTHPFLFAAVWFLDLAPAPWFAAVVGMEIVVALTEALWHRRFLGVPWRRALGVSFAANGLSYGLGLLMF